MAHSTRRKNNGGCWLTAIITMFVVMILVLVGLFLPPFDIYNRLFSEPFAVLQVTGDSIPSEDGVLQVIAAADYPQDANFGVRRPTALPQASFTGGAAAEWVLAARSALPPRLALQSAVYSIETGAPAPGAVILSMELPRSGVSPDILDMYGWYNETTGGQWRFLPSTVKSSRMEAITDDLPDAVAIFQAAPMPPTIQVTYDVNQVMTTEVGNIATIVSPAGLQPTLNGSLTGSLAPGFALNSVYMVMPVLRDFTDARALDTATVEAILSNSTLRQKHVKEITAFTLNNNFDGVFIDYRGLPPEQSQNFSAFIRELKKSFQDTTLLVGVVVPAAENNSGTWETGAYDWRAIGSSADYVLINLDINPRLFTPGTNEPVEAMLRRARGEISRYKILIGLSARSVREIAASYTPIGYDEGLAGLGNVKQEAASVSETGSIEPGTQVTARLDGMRAIAGVDTTINAPYIEYLNGDSSTAARVWMTTGDALRFRMDSIIPFALGGVGFDDLLSGDIADNVLPTIQDFTTGLPAAPSPVNLVLHWRIEGSSGLIGETTTGISDPLVVTMSAPDGYYAINVAVEGAGEDVDSPRTGVQVAQFRPTATPTPLPTATPTPLPTATFTPAPIIPTPGSPAGGGGGGNNNGSGGGNNNGGGGGANPTGGGFQAVRPSGGSIATGPFEYGGQVTSAGSGRAIGPMQRAGMTWMKVQRRYYPGLQGGGVPADDINAAHAAGFKVLISTVGTPNDLAAGGADYIRNYANWLASTAAAGADAIEVWNEPNIEREWPIGQISGGAYAGMLSQAYAAIKGANPNTMVISAAPAPTGAEAAYPGKVVNDDHFLQDLINAGGLNSMDCLGVHYNEGIVPPNQTSGDPRGDNYYTRYFLATLNTYRSIVGQARPLCFTELGYLTSEGYGPIDPYFSWAANVTVAQQAAWLAQAAALASQSGSVRLMIVWNVDFTQYGSDPQGGYAIIRPDGSCPACDALAAAR